MVGEVPCNESLCGTSQGMIWSVLSPFLKMFMSLSLSLVYCYMCLTCYLDEAVNLCMKSLSVGFLPGALSAYAVDMWPFQPHVSLSWE